MRYRWESGSEDIHVRWNRPAPVRPSHQDVQRRFHEFLGTHGLCLCSHFRPVCPFCIGQAVQHLPKRSQLLLESLSFFFARHVWKEPEHRTISLFRLRCTVFTSFPISYLVFRGGKAGKRATQFHFCRYEIMAKLLTFVPDLRPFVERTSHIQDFRRSLRRRGAGDYGDNYRHPHSPEPPSPPRPSTPTLAMIGTMTSPATGSLVQEDQSIANRTAADRCLHYFCKHRVGRHCLMPWRAPQIQLFPSGVPSAGPVA